MLNPVLHDQEVIIAFWKYAAKIVCYFTAREGEMFRVMKLCRLSVFRERVKEQICGGKDVICTSESVKNYISQSLKS